MTIKPITFRALQAIEATPGNFDLKLVPRTVTELKEDELLIRVHYSSLNYKDALSAGGNRAVTRSYPHIPGIDASGIVEASMVQGFNVGEEVLVTGFDFGMNTDGGFAEYVIVPVAWVVKMPKGLTLKTTMIFGTAGFTAGLSVAALIRNGITSDKGLIAVSGATGGVGSIAVAILSKLGYKVAAISSKDAGDFVLSIGAKQIIPRSEMEDQSGRPLLKPRFTAAIDTVGGNVLATLIKSLEYGGVVTTCGMVNGGDLHTTVFPFILKGIQLIGIDSVSLPLAERLPIWQKLAEEWLPESVAEITTEIGFNDIAGHLKAMLDGKAKGRTLVRIIS
jgi:putative YhdH/YhfP family quinone oxidoreductase